MLRARWSDSSLPVADGIDAGSELAWQLRHSDMLEAKEIARAALRLARGHNDSKLLADALAAAGGILQRTSNTIEQLEIFKFRLEDVLSEL